MNVKIKKLNENAKMPYRAHNTDAGFDLYATSRVFDEHGAVVYGTGIAFEIPEGYVGMLFPRSSNAKKDLLLSNSVGILDAGFRGEVMFKFKPSLTVCDKDGHGLSETDYLGTKQTDFDTQFVSFYGRSKNYPDVEEGCEPFQPRMYEIGDRIGQLVVVKIPDVVFEWADELSESERGEGGYGSSGK